MALRLARYLGTSPELWLGLQSHYDLDMAQDRAEAQITRDVKRCALLPEPTAT